MKTLMNDMNKGWRLETIYSLEDQFSFLTMFAAVSHLEHLLLGLMFTISMIVPNYLARTPWLLAFGRGVGFSMRENDGRNPSQVSSAGPPHAAKRAVST